MRLYWLCRDILVSHAPFWWSLDANCSFADREFYQDWWNSTSWDQFSRKWNKPVHTFLLRHVYASTIEGLKLSRTSATFITFLLSALCHELVMAVVTKKIRPYLFLMQVSHGSPSSSIASGCRKEDIAVRVKPRR